MPYIETKKIVACALFTALIACATIIIQIPMPISGYVNLGDAFVLLGAFILGPVYGTISAGLGSMLADVLTGYVIFAPATLIIKALMVLAFCFLFKLLKRNVKMNVFCFIISGIVAEIIMTMGYFFYSALIMGEGLVAATSIPGNLIQGAIGILVSTVSAISLQKMGIKNMF